MSISKFHCHHCPLCVEWSSSEINICLLPASIVTCAYSGFTDPSWSNLFQKLVLSIRSVLHPLMCPTTEFISFTFFSACAGLVLKFRPFYKYKHSLLSLFSYRCNRVWERQIEIRLFEVKFGDMRKRSDTSHWAECSVCTVAGLFPLHNRHCPHYVSHDDPGRRLQRWLLFNVTVDY